jgi:hypothetical protein
VKLEVVKLPRAKRVFVLLPLRWVVEQTFAGPGRFAACRATMSGSRNRWKAGAGTGSRPY